MPLKQGQKAVLYGCNAFLTATEKDGSDTRMRVGFSRSRRSSELPRLFTGTCWRKMLDGKDYRTFNMVFRFLAGFIDRAAGLIEKVPMTRFHNIFPDRISILSGYESSVMTDYVPIGELSRHIMKFRQFQKPARIRIVK